MRPDPRSAQDESGRFGYRYLDIDYETDDLLYDMAMAGPYAGLGIWF